MKIKLFNKSILVIFAFLVTLLSFHVDIKAEALDESTTEALSIVDIKIKDKEVRAGDTVYVTVKFNQDIRNLSSAYLYFEHSIHTNEWIAFSTLRRINGTTIELSGKVGNYKLDGDWYFRYVIFYLDTAEGSQRNTILPTDIKEDIYNNAIINITGTTPDITPPTLNNFNLDKNIVYKGESITFEVEVDDDVSGIRSVSLYVNHFNDKDTSLLRGTRIQLNRVGNSKVFRGKFKTPSDAQTGTWYVDKLFATDNADNNKIYYVDELDQNRTGKANFKVIDTNYVEPMSDYVVLESQLIQNIVIDGDLYIGPKAIAYLSQSVIVKGNVYVLGAMNVTGSLKITGTLYAQMVSWGSYGNSTYTNGEVRIRYGSHSIPSTHVSNAPLNIPHVLENTVENELKAIDGTVKLKGRYVPVVDMYINGVMIDKEKTGIIDFELDVPDLLEVELSLVDVYGRRINYEYPLIQNSSDEDAILVETLDIKTNNFDLKVGESSKIQYDVKPDNAFNKNVVFQSQNPKVATVTKEGLITAVGKGTTKILLTTVQGRITKEINIKVKQPVTGVAFTEHKLNLDISKTTKMSWNILPNNADNQDVSFSVKDETIAVVDDFGFITGKSEGETEIIITTDDGQFTDVIKVVVSRLDISLLEYYDLSAIEYSGLPLTPDIIIVDQDRELERDIDYRLKYSNNIEVGYATVHVEGIGKYKGNASLNFEIKQRNVTSLSYSSGRVKKGTTIGELKLIDFKAFDSDNNQIEGNYFFIHFYDHSHNPNNFNYLVETSGYYEAVFYPFDDNYAPYHFSVYFEVVQFLDYGWNLYENNWYYAVNDEPITGWGNIDGRWYYFDNNGIMQTQWQYISGNWYYMSDSGAMQTNWVRDFDKWYYMNNNGAMLTGWLKVSNKWYFMNSSGTMQTGWVNDSGKWYYMNSSGAMLTGWVNDYGKWYFMNNSGMMQTGWLKVSNKWYYLNSNGLMLTGWQKISGKWYYFYSSGDMAYNASIDGYRLSSSGAMI